MTDDRIDVFLERTGSIAHTENWQLLLPQVGFTCNGILKGIVYGAEYIQMQMNQHPKLQIWRPVGNTTYKLVSQYTLIAPSTRPGLVGNYDLPFNFDFQTGDVIGYHQPNIMISQFTLMVEAVDDESLQCAYATTDPNSLFSTLDVEGLLLTCSLNVFLHLETGILFIWRYFLFFANKMLPHVIFGSIFSIQILSCLWDGLYEYRENEIRDEHCSIYHR